MSSGASNAPRFGMPPTPITWEGISLASIGEQQVSAANDWLRYLRTLAGDILPITINPVFPSLPQPPSLEDLNTPTFETVDYIEPDFPDPFTEDLNVDDYLPEAFDENPPTLVFGTAPAAFSGTVPDAPGVNVTYEDPGDLTVTLPAPPNLLTLTISNFDGITIPDFTEEAPTIELSEPSIIPYDPGTGYASAMLAALQDTLTQRFTEGGTGLNPDVENAIWDRGREREMKAKQEAILSLERMESLGYALPPGIYLDARLKIETEMGEKIIGHSREVMIKQAELEQTNVLKAIDSAIELEKTLIGYETEFERRKFETAKYSTEAQIALFNARVEAYKAMLDVYRSKIAAYEAQIRGEIAKVDAYRARVAAEQAKAEVNTALVQQYKIESDVALSAIDVYKARIDAIRSKAEIEKLKIEIYGEQVRGFTAGVQAYTAQVEGYKAATAAEATKVDAYTSQVRAYTAQVEAGAKAIDARIQRFRVLLEGKNSEYDGYKAAVQGAIARTQAIASKNETVANSFRAEVDAITSYNDSRTKQWEATIEQVQRTTEIAVQVAKANAELATSSRSIALEAAKVGGQVSAQVAAAALGAFNWSVNQSFGQSMSSSWQESLSDSYSDSEAYIENVSA